MARSHILKGFADIDAGLWIHKYYPGLNTNLMVKQLLESGFTITDAARFEIAQIFNELGFADKTTRTLTAQGESFYTLWQTKHSVAIDVLHGLQYGLWTKKKPELNIASWAYKTICDYLWNYHSLPDNSKELVSYINDLRSSHSDLIPREIGDAFSNKSINDAYDWLLSLEPPVLLDVTVGAQIKSFKNAKFERRPYCSTALFVLGLAYIIRESENNFGDLILIDDNKKRGICLFCLIEETSFDFMLDESLRQFDFISLQKEWEMFIDLHRKPEISDFLEA